MSCVYGLFSTKEPDRIRYVGISRNDTADKRLAVHLSSAKNDKRVSHLPVYKWINRHISDGHSIGYVIIESGLSWDEACVLEMQHISDYKSMGIDLLNATDGGEGRLGTVVSAETREKIRSYWTEEKRAAQREAIKSRPPHVFTEDDLKKMSESAKIRHENLRNSGLAWGLDVGPKDKTPKEIKDRILKERNSGLSYRTIANSLNSDNIPTANGGRWYATSVKNIYDRLNPS